MQSPFPHLRARCLFNTNPLIHSPAFNPTSSYQFLVAYFTAPLTAKQETKFLAGASVINTLHSTRDMIRTDSVRIKNSTGQCPSLIMYINRSVLYGLDTTGKFEYRQCKATKLGRQGKLGFTQWHCFETPQGNF